MTETVLRLRANERSATVRLLAIAVLYAALSIGFLASVWTEPAPTAGDQASEPASEPSGVPVAMR